MLVAQQSRISYTWFLWYTMNTDGSIHIHRHDRLHDVRESDLQPITKSEYQLIETQTGRIVTAATIDGKEYKVSNPKFVFSYQDEV